jgi:uncharacterized protein
MKLEHSFSVPASIDQAWATLMDVEQVAPCMPGATLTSVTDDEFTGGVKVKLGPIALSYGMTGRFLEQDAERRRALIDARGKEQRGSGTAAAQIELMLTELGETSTQADVVIDLDITGRPAQFGRSALSDVSASLVSQFADKLAITMTPDSRTSGPGAEQEADATAANGSAPEEETLDVIRLVAVPLLRRAAPAVGFLAALLLLVILRRLRRR